MSDAKIEYVDLESARTAPGMRLVVAGLLPSPWTEAAKGLFHVKGIPIRAVRFRRGDDELRAWTGAHNVPVALYDDEPPRTGWAEILALAERLGGGAALVPGEPERRARLHGLAHELAGEGGFGWSARLVMIDGSLSTGGARSFPLPVAQYLARKYGYAPERVPRARARIREVLALLDAELARSRAAGHAYLLGAELTALDIYLAAFLNPASGLSAADCPAMRPEPAAAFAYLAETIGDEIPTALAAHRAFVYARHLPWPIAL